MAAAGELSGNLLRPLETKFEIEDRQNDDVELPLGDQLGELPGLCGLGWGSG